MSVFRDYFSYTISATANNNLEEDITITRNTRFFVQMPRLSLINIPGVCSMHFGRVYTGNDTDLEWTECYINEDEYLIDMNDNTCPYKIKLTACDQSFGSETYYWSDFISLVQEGIILIKNNEFEYPMPYKIQIPIPNSCAKIVEEGIAIVDIRDYIEH